MSSLITLGFRYLKVRTLLTTVDTLGRLWAFLDRELLGNLDPLRHFWHFGYLATLYHFGTIKFVGSPKSQDGFPRFFFISEYMIILMFHPYLVASVWGFFGVPEELQAHK